MPPLEINLTSEDQTPEGLTGYIQQWDNIINNNTIILKCYGITSASLTISLKNLYVIQPDSYAIQYIGNDSTINMKRDSFLTAINPNNSDTKGKILVIFAVSEAARFESFRYLLFNIMVMNCDSDNLNWQNLRGIINNWVKIKKLIRTNWEEHFQNMDPAVPLPSSTGTEPISMIQLNLVKLLLDDNTISTGSPVTNKDISSAIEYLSNYTNIEFF